MGLTAMGSIENTDAAEYWPSSPPPTGVVIALFYSCGCCYCGYCRYSVVTVVTVYGLFCMACSFPVAPSDTAVVGNDTYPFVALYYLYCCCRVSSLSTACWNWLSAVARDAHTSPIRLGRGLAYLAYSSMASSAAEVKG